MSKRIGKVFYRVHIHTSINNSSPKLSNIKKKQDAIEFARQVESNRETQYLLSNSVLSTPLSQLIHEFVPPGKDPCIAGRVAWWNEQIGHLRLLMYKNHNSK